MLAGFLIPLVGANFVFAANASCFLLVVLAIRRWKQPTAPTSLPTESFFKSFGTVICNVRYVPGLQVVLARNFLFALFISVIPALMPVVGLQVLHLGSSQLGFLFTSMGAGSVIGAVFVISWLRARFSPDSVTLSANLLIVLAYALMAFVRQVEVFFVIAAVAGVAWTLSASEMWVAAQRAMPSWVRGRANAAVIMISQGAITLGSVIWGSAAAIVGVSSTLFAAGVLFLLGLLLSRRLSINFAGNPEERVPGVLSITEDPKAPTSTALTVLFPS
jgi:predicted MFS family arabinose efflux permease